MSVLNEISDCVTDAAASLGVAPVCAAAIGEAAAERVARILGGNAPYIPKRVPGAAARRDAAILKERQAGTPVTKIAKRFHLGKSAVYKALQQARERAQ